MTLRIYEKKSRFFHDLLEICSDRFFHGIEKCKMIIIVEESPKSFGWGSEIVSFMAENGLADGKSIARIGAAELPIPSSILLENKILPSISQIIDEIISTGII